MRLNPFFFFFFCACYSTFSLLPPLHNLSLIKERDHRPSYAQLLEDPWIQQYAKVDFDMAAYLVSLKKK